MKIVLACFAIYRDMHVHRESDVSPCSVQLPHPLSLSSSSTFPSSLPFSVFHSAQTGWVTQQRLKSWGCAGPKKSEPKFVCNLVNNLYIFYNFLTGSSLWGTVHLVQASPPNIQSLSFTLCIRVHVTS